MNRSVPSLLLITPLLLIPIGCQPSAHVPHADATAEPEQPPVQTRQDIMKKKLELTENALAGLALEDFKKVETNAYTLHMLSQESDFQVYTTPAYTHFSHLFRDRAELLYESARSKDMKAMAENYTTLTQTCVQCHQTLRPKTTQK